MHSEIEQLDNNGLRKFGLVTGLIVVVLFGGLLPWIFDHGSPRWPWYVAVILWLPALVYPRALDPVYHLWMRIGLVLGWVNTRIILGAVFYVMFTPIRLIWFLIGKDPMHRKADASATSYRIEARNSPRDQMEKPY